MANSRLPAARPPLPAALDVIACRQGLIAVLACQVALRVLAHGRLHHVVGAQHPGLHLERVDAEHSVKGHAKELRQGMEVRPGAERQADFFKNSSIHGSLHAVLFTASARTCT